MSSRLARAHARPATPLLASGAASSVYVGPSAVPRMVDAEGRLDAVAWGAAALERARGGVRPSRLDPPIGLKLPSQLLRQVLDALTAHQQAWDAEDLDAVLTIGACTSAAVQAVITHPAATAAHWEALAAVLRQPGHLLLLAHHAPARRVPAVFAALRATEHPAVLAHLALDVDDATFDALLPAIARRDGAAAIRVLEDPRHAHRLAGLPASAIEPLMTHADPAIRLALRRVFRPLLDAATPPLGRVPVAALPKTIFSTPPRRTMPPVAVSDRDRMALVDDLEGASSVA